jgi:hypothetical protein
MILSVLRKLLRLLKPKLFSTESVVIKKTNIDFFLITYIRSRASKFIGAKQSNNNNQTHIFFIPRAKISKTLVNVPRTAPVLV